MTQKAAEEFENPYVRIAYLCRICSKEQSKKFKFDWKRHYLTHNTEPKSYVCNICGKAYNQQGPLNKHMKNKHPSNEPNVKPLFKTEYFESN